MDDDRAPFQTVEEQVRMGVDPGTIQPRGVAPAPGSPLGPPTQWFEMLPWKAEASAEPPPAVPVPPKAVPVPQPPRVLPPPPRRLIPPPPPQRPLALPSTEPLERAVDTYDPVLPAPWHRFLRAIALGVCHPGAAVAADRERRMVAKVRTRRREPLVVAFVAGKGGVGTTTAAAGVALTLALLRKDSTALVDVCHGTGSLGRWLAGQPAPTAAQVASSLPAPHPQNQAESAPGPLATRPLRVIGTLGVVDGSPWHAPVPSAVIVSTLNALRADHAFCLADVGNDMSEGGNAVLDQTDHLVLVTTTGHDAIESTRLVLQRIREIEPRRLGNIVLAVCCLTSRQHRRTSRRLRSTLGVPGDRIVVVPFDPALAAGGRLVLNRLRPRTREAFLSLAGFVACPGPADRLRGIP
jgi:MinD-like ATPase involved in chromosome partitioning or flagellar assembly